MTCRLKVGSLPIRSTDVEPSEAPMSTIVASCRSTLSISICIWSGDGVRVPAGEQIAPFAAAVTRLYEIPGVGVTAAQAIIAEIGLDMTRFPTPAHLALWARFAPGVSESAGRKKGNSGTGKGNRYLARALGEAAVGVRRTDTFLVSGTVGSPTAAARRRR
jgi:Transposase IS116/IS110/IS902 family